MPKLTWCDGRHERNGGQHNALDYSLAGHHLHCPRCDVHITSLLMCPNCGTRYTLIDALNAEMKYAAAKGTNA